MTKESIGIHLSGGKEWFTKFHAENPAEKQIDFRVTHEGVTKDFTYEELVKALGF